MLAVLMSIQPKWVWLIAWFKKTVEIRKTKPKLKTPFKCYIYETKTPLRWNKAHNGIIGGEGGYVVGEFVCDEITYLGNISTDPWCRLLGNVHEALKRLVTKDACLTEEALLEYGGKYGWHISNLVIYDKPKKLSEFYRCDNSGNRVPITRAPQSWCYVEEHVA